MQIFCSIAKQLNISRSHLVCIKNFIRHNDENLKRFEKCSICVDMSEVSYCIDRQVRGEAWYEEGEGAGGRQVKVRRVRGKRGDVSETYGPPPPTLPSFQVSEKLNCFRFMFWAPIQAGQFSTFQQLPRVNLWNTRNSKTKLAIRLLFLGCRGQYFYYKI